MESEPFKAFMQAFFACIYAKNEDAFTEARQHLETIYPVITEYCNLQYFNLWGHKLLHHHTNKIRHFGIQSTSRGEGNHNTMKSWLTTSKSSVFTFWLLIEQLWKQQQHEYLAEKASSGMRAPMSLANKPFWTAVNIKIYPQAVQNAKEQWDHRAEGNRLENNCTGVFRRTLGIPCKHDIFEMERDDRVLRKEDFDHHYWIKRPPPAVEEVVATTDSQPPDLLPLETLRQRRARLGAQATAEGGRSQHTATSSRRRRGDGATGNRRIVSGHERITPRSVLRTPQSQQSMQSTIEPPVSLQSPPSTAPAGLASGGLQWQEPVTQRSWATAARRGGGGQAPL